MAVCFLFCFLLLFVCRSSVTAEEQMFDGNQTLVTMARMETKMAELEENVLSILEDYREEMDELRTQNGKIKRKNALLKKRVSILEDRREEMNEVFHTQREEMEEELRKQNGTLVTLIADFNDVRDDVRNITTDIEILAGDRREEMNVEFKKQNGKLETLIADFIDVRDDVRNITADMENVAESIKDTPKVAFNAYTTSSGSFATDEVVIFPTVVLNEGGGYNSNTGKFTAPISGLYNFQAHICNLIGSHMIVSIVHGRRTLATTTVFEGSSHSCSSVSAPAQVNGGESVFIKSSYSGSKLFANEHRWPSFSGFLVNE